jgi:hypothetical protein
MTTRLLAAPLDSNFLSQRSSDPSTGLVHAVRIIPQHAACDRNGSGVVWTPRQSQDEWQGSVIQDGQDRLWSGVLNADYAAPSLSGWSDLDAAAQYMFYDAMLATPPSGFSLNVYA